MIVALSTRSGSLEAHIDERFGRAPTFVLVDLVSGGFTAIANPAVDAPSGAGPRAVEVLARHGTRVVLTGRVGPKAARALEAAGIRFVEGVEGVAAEALEAWLEENPMTDPRGVEERSHA